MDLRQLKEKAKFIRKKAFEMVIAAGKGHLGGSLSCVEILVALYYGGILNFNPKNPRWPGRDIFILSKGHANNCFYVILADLGFFPIAELSRFSKKGGILGQHCDPMVPGIEFITGSLGHGLGIAAGICLGNKLDKKKNLTFVLLGDGESQEGSVWEAGLFAAHHKLNNLIAIVDRNRIGAEDYTEKSCSLEPLHAKWEAFGWQTRVVKDGHSFAQIMQAFKDCRRLREPLMIIANTVKGKGVSCMENLPKAHHTLPKDKELLTALRDME